jgi:hypothetical protein
VAGHDGVFHDIFCQGTNEPIVRDGADHFDGRILIVVTQDQGNLFCTAILLRPVSDFPLKVLVRDQIRRTERIARLRTKIIALLEPVDDSLSLKMGSVPTDQRIRHDILRQRTNKFSWRNHHVFDRLV